MTSTTHEVYALRYGTADGMKSHFFYSFGSYREPDAPQSVDFTFWLIRNGDTAILVDTGYDKDRGRIRRRTQATSPVELLRRLDVGPEEIDRIVVSHMHYDHIGNLGTFPNATVTVAGAEYNYWLTPGTQERNINSYLVDADEVQVMRGLEREGRLQLVADAQELIPGVELATVGGHTPGSLITTVATSDGAVVIASDAVHFMEELEAQRPFALFHDLDDLYRTYDLLRGLQAQPGTRVIAGHDPRVAEGHEAVAVDCFDLTKPSQ